MNNFMYLYYIYLVYLNCCSKNSALHILCKSIGYTTGLIVSEALLRPCQTSTEAAVQRCSSERCSENMQQIYRGTPMPKCDFNKVAKQLY